MQLLNEQWQEYAQFHGSVTTSFQLEIYKAAREYLSGDVIDCGCGSAKIAPLLFGYERVGSSLGVEKIDSYLGVDCSPEMIDVATHVINQIGDNNFTVKLSLIEDVQGSFDSAVSIQSFYAWDNPNQVLQKIYDFLNPGGLFVLATPNNSLDINLLLEEARMENICHPDFEVFENHNKQIASQDINSIEMGDLLTLTQSVGFKTVECHQRFLLGGLCFVVMQKMI